MYQYDPTERNQQQKDDENVSAPPRSPFTESKEDPESTCSLDVTVTP